MKSPVLASLLTFAALTANAELMNVSSASTHTGSQRAAACTIVDTGTRLISGIVMVFAFAEGEGAGNPSIRSWSLNRNLSVSNENWMDGITIASGGQTVHMTLRELDARNGNPYGTLLRSPMRPTDAAIVIPALPGEAICVESYDRSGSATPSTVNIALTDMNAIAFKNADFKRLGGELAPYALTPEALERLANNFLR